MARKSPVKKTPAKKRLAKTSPSKHPAPSKPRVGRRALRRLNVLIHGTGNQLARWYRPVAERNLYQIVANELFPGDLMMSFRWNGGIEVADFKDAARRLIDKCEALQPDLIRIFCHSNGANVTNYATKPGTKPGHPGLKVCTIVYLAPAVRRSILPHVGNVESQRWFVFRPHFDEILENSQATHRDYASLGLGTYETSKIVAPRGHWKPIRVAAWDDSKLGLPALVKQVCKG